MRYAQIRSLDISNGENVGVALFVQGCHFHCKNCFNSETWDFNGGKEWTPDVKEKFLELVDRQYIKRVSILGGEPLADENLDDVLDLITEINKRYNFQKIDPVNPCKMGVSEYENANKIRLLFPQKTIWLYTGYRVRGIQEGLFVLTPNVITDKISDHKEIINMANEDVKRSDIIKKCDVLIDGRYIEEKRDITLKWCGSSNQRVINVQKSLQKNEIVLHCD